MEKVSIPVVKNVLEAHEKLAIKKWAILDSNGILTLNLMSSPGAGKTSLLEQTIKGLKNQVEIAVIEGDIQSDEDARRIQKRGVQVVQINTGGACHLDGSMIQSALESLDLNPVDLLIIENVGNLVCPAEFNLGEHFKVMLLSVTEGHDKPLKYPLMFQKSSVLLINKIDLLPYIDCDIEKIKSTCKSLNPQIETFEISCKTSEGLENWFNWIINKLNEFKQGTVS